MELSEKIDLIELEVAKVKSIVSPLTQLKSELEKQIHLAGEEQAYTGNYPETRRSILVSTVDKTLAELSLSSDTLLHAVDIEIEKRMKVVDGNLEKINKIKSILKD